MLPTCLAESRHDEKRAVGEKNIHHFMRFVMSKIKPTFGTKADGSDGGLWSIDHLVVCVPTQVVVSVAVVVSQNSIEGRVCLLRAQVTNVGENWRPRMRNSCGAGICVGDAVGDPRRHSGFGHDVSEHGELLGLPRDRR